MKVFCFIIVFFLLYPTGSFGVNALELLLDVYKKYEIAQPQRNKVYYMQYYTRTISKKLGDTFESAGTFDVWVSALQMRVKGLGMESYRSDDQVISVNRDAKEIMIADSKNTLFDKNRKLKIAEFTSAFFKDCFIQSFYQLENDNFPASKGDFVLLLTLSEAMQSYTMVSSLLYTIRAKDSTICTFTVNYTASNPDYVRTDIWYKELTLSEGVYVPVEEVVKNGKGIGEYADFVLTDVRKKRKNF